VKCHLVNLTRVQNIAVIFTGQYCLPFLGRSQTVLYSGKNTGAELTIGLPQAPHKQHHGHGALAAACWQKLAIVTRL